MNLKIVVVLLLMVGIFSCNDGERWAFTIDKANRPITGCLRITADAWAAVVMSMNCKKSVMDSMHLCSQGRMLLHHASEASCDQNYSSHKSSNGEHTLASDPWEKLIQ